MLALCPPVTARLFQALQPGLLRRFSDPLLTPAPHMSPLPCSHQMLLVSNKEAAAVAQAWMRALIAKGSKGGGSGGAGSGGAAGGDGGGTTGGPRSRL